MSKKLFSFFLLLLPLCVAAAPVSKDQALQKARTFMSHHSGMAKNKALKSVRTPLKTVGTLSTASYYVFNVGDQQGFIVVSGDDRTPAILGYATNGTFDEATIPDNMRAWLEGYEQQINMLDHYPLANATAVTHDAIEPLVKSTWNQGSPYNGLCPTDLSTGQRSVTGCLATAMAQIVNYHQYPASTLSTIPAYYTSTYDFYVPAIPPTAIDWQNMLDAYDGNATNEQKQAVATLMQLCGAAMKMDYSSNESNAYTYDAFLAFRDYFGYDKSMRCMQRGCFRAAEWDALIYNELKEQRPVYFVGQSLGGGHAFIIDGYSHDGLYHVNWGWGGYCDNYFLLSILDPESNSGIGASSSTDGYSFYQEAIIGIQKPTETAEPIETTQLATDLCIVNDSQTEFTRQTNGSFIVPIYVRMSNPSGTIRTYDVGCGIFNADNELVEIHPMYTYELDFEYYVYSYGNLNLFSQLPDGNYTIKAISKPNDSDTWEEGYSSFDMSIEATLKDDKLTTRNYTYNMSGSIVSNMEQPTMGSRVSIQATLTNNGTNINQVAYLMVNGIKMGGTYVEAEEGETITINLSYLPIESGTNELSLILPYGENGIELAKGSVDVLGSETPHLLFNLELKDLRPNSTMPHTKADITAHIHNNSRNAYNNRICLALITWNDEKGYNEICNQQFFDFSLEAAADGVQKVEFEGLDNHRFYYMQAYYIDENDKWAIGISNPQGFTTNEPADGKEDMTYMLTNPDFEQSNYGWTVDAVSGGNVRVGGTYENLCFEAWNNRQFDIYQDVTGLPAGIYEIQVQGFYRKQRGANAWNTYQKGDVTVPVYVYLDNSSTPLKNIFSEPSNAGFYSGDYYCSPTGLYFPNDMSTSAQAFSADMYRQSAFGLVMDEAQQIKIGVKGATNQNNDSWAIWDNFKLIYLGFDSQYIRPALQQALETAEKLTSQTMGKTTYQKLTGIMAEAEEAVQTTDGERMFQLLSQLYIVNEEAVTSISSFQPLIEALDELQWAIDNYHVASSEVQQQAISLHKLITDNAYGHQYEEEDIEEQIYQINEQIILLRIPENLDMATATAPVECTTLLATPSFERDGENSIQGWYGQGNFNFGNTIAQTQAMALEAYQRNFLLYQPISRIPNGYYAMQVSAFYRYGTANEDADHYRLGEQCNDAYIFMSDVTEDGDYISKPLLLMSSGASPEPVGSGEEITNSDNLFVPNDMISSVAYFQKGRYTNYLLFNVTQESMYIGIEKINTVMADWVIMDDFRLFYYGTERPVDEQLGIEETCILGQSQSAKACFDLSGRRVSDSYNGFVIRRQTLPNGTVVTRKFNR